MAKKKEFKITINAPLVLCFTLACLITLGLNYLTGGRSNELLFITYHSSLLSPLTYLRFFTYVLGQSGWSHFIGNASYLLLLGPGLEEKHGAKNLALVMVITAVMTAVVHYIFFPNTGLCGASGIVFAFILMTSFTAFRSGEIPISVILVAVIYIGQQVLEGLFVVDNVSNLSHIIGGVVGAVAGYLLNRRSR